MRPARKGPENLFHPLKFSRHSIRFNEAGPQGAGKHPVLAYRRP